MYILPLPSRFFWTWSGIAVSYISAAYGPATALSARVQYMVYRSVPFRASSCSTTTLSKPPAPVRMDIASCSALLLSCTCELHTHRHGEPAVGHASARAEGQVG